MPRGKANQTTETPAPAPAETPAATAETNGETRKPKPTGFQIEVWRLSNNIATGLKTMHRSNLLGQQIDCPTGDEETCDQCQTMFLYQEQAQTLVNEYNFDRFLK